jgi:hypothetical protein
MGVLRDSVIVVDNLQTIQRSLIDRKLSECPLMDQVDAALRLLLALE